VKIAGVEKLSTVDYPGQLAAVFFTPGCNMKCFYCHNHQLIDQDAQPLWFGEECALEWLKEREGFLDAVVISGGEPTLQPDLASFIRKIKKLNYRVKLDTNGANPDALNTLIEENLLDYIAMDIKAPRDQYQAVCGVAVDLAAIERSIRIILNSGIPYEFRTTVPPQFSCADVAAIAAWISGAERYTLQQFRKPETTGSIHDFRLLGAPHDNAWLATALAQAQEHVADCHARGFATPHRDLVTS